MFSQSLGRVVRTAPPLASSAASTTRPCAASMGATATGRRSHARRLSSNKAAPPPGDGHRGSPAPANPNDANRTPTDGEGRSTSRLPKRKTRDTSNHAATKQRDEAFANVPSVPSTSHLKEDDVKISSFFALHRPISVTIPYPPQSESAKSFNAIFDAPKNSNNRINDTIYTLNNAISSMEGGARRSGIPQTQEEREARLELLQQQYSNGSEGAGQYIDAQSSAALNLEYMIRQYKPFNTPPAPIALDPAYENTSNFKATTGVQQSLEPKSEKQATPTLKRNTYSTTLTIEETFQPNGETTFVASCSPIRRVLARRRRDGGRLWGSSGTPILGSRDVQDVGDFNKRRGMLLISVKRQRKLKMKKKKYKKLMRRTRTLRRKLGRD